MSLYSFAKRILKTIKQKELIPIVEAVPSKELLNKKTALITGGTGGIGFAIAKALVSNGGGE